LFDPLPSAGTKPKALLDFWRASVEMTCIACRGSATTALLTEPTNPNAPWLLQGTWRRQTTLGVLSTGFVGLRNYALPLSTAMPLAGNLDQFASGSWRASVFAPSSQWYLTAAVEKTLTTRSDGTSFGVTADLLIPVETELIAGADDPRIDALTSRTVRFGIVVRW
jgi:hypothetical protein